MGDEKRSHVFALTGGIGSGKSSVAQVWRESGVPVVDADQLAREVVAKGTPALEQIVTEFGLEVLDQAGALDREKLGEVVFSDPEARARLNAIVHPEVRKAAEKAFSAHAAQGEFLVCYEIPLLFETSQEERFRPVVVVSATPLQQMERVAARDGLPPEAVATRVRSQIPLREKEMRADILIVNGGSLEDLRVRAQTALAEVRAAVSGS